jgi:hypothetical protein
MAFDSDTPDAMRLAALVRNAPGGGLHRAELEERLHRNEDPQRFQAALMRAYRRRWIDFGRQWVFWIPADQRKENSPGGLNPGERAG